MHELTRRDCFRWASGALVAGSVAPVVFGQDSEKTARKVRPKLVAGVVSVYHHNSHADVILGKILEGWKQDGGPGSALKLASVYIDQFHANDIGRDVCKKPVMKLTLTFLIVLLLTSLPNLRAVAADEPIRIGRQRQLFLDDFIIEHTEHLTRRVQQARKFEGNPLFVKQHDWEPAGYVVPSVMYDEEEKLFKAWLDGYGIGVFYFTSKDGITWERPLLRLFPKFDSEPTNRVILSGNEIDIKDAPPDKLDYMRSRELGWKYFGHCSGVIKDMRDPDPQRRYKMAALGRPVFECDLKRTKKTAGGGHPTGAPTTRTPSRLPATLDQSNETKRTEAVRLERGCGRCIG